MDLDPLTGDGIDADNKGRDPEEEEIPNEVLDEYLDRYQCQHLYPFCERVMWLSDVKEVLGYIPAEFNVVHDEILALTVLLQEKRLRESIEAHRTKRNSERMSSQASAASAATSRMKH